MRKISNLTTFELNVDSNTVSKPIQNLLGHPLSRYSRTRCLLIGVRGCISDDIGPENMLISGRHF